MTAMEKYMKSPGLLRSLLQGEKGMFDLSLSPKRFDRIEPCGLAGRHDAEEETDPD